MSQLRWWPAGGLSAAVTNELLVVVTLILSMLIFLFFFHHLRAKLYRHAAPPTSAHPRRNGRIRILLAPNYAPLTQQGLSVEAIRALPVTSFRLQDFEDGLECAICLSELFEGEKVRVLSGCGHGFHVECIDMWLFSHNTCPVCRRVVDAPPVGAHGAPVAVAAAEIGNRGGMLVIDIPGRGTSGAEDERGVVRGSVRVIPRTPFVM